MIEILNRPKVTSFNSLAYGSFFIGSSVSADKSALCLKAFLPKSDQSEKQAVIVLLEGDLHDANVGHPVLLLNTNALHDYLILDITDLIDIKIDIAPKNNKAWVSSRGGIFGDLLIDAQDIYLGIDWSSQSKQNGNKPFWVDLKTGKIEFLTQDHREQAFILSRWSLNNKLSEPTFLFKIDTIAGNTSPANDIKKSA